MLTITTPALMGVRAVFITESGTTDSYPVHFWITEQYSDDSIYTTAQVANTSGPGFTCLLSVDDVAGTFLGYTEPAEGKLGVARLVDGFLADKALADRADRAVEALTEQTTR